jgi:hypothetical protein
MISRQKRRLGRTIMSISDLSDAQLDQFDANYRRLNKMDGGKYSLSEILLERRRRSPSAFGVREVAAKIVELSASSPDGLITYGDVWNAFRPGRPWEGHKTLRIVADSLYRVVHYCVANRLPILTVLVVRGGTRRLTSEAIENIFNECRDLGVNVGHDPSAFVDRQIELSRAVVSENLPEAAC